MESSLPPSLWHLLLHEESCVEELRPLEGESTDRSLTWARARPAEQAPALFTFEPLSAHFDPRFETRSAPPRAQHPTASLPETPAPCRRIVTSRPPLCDPQSSADHVLRRNRYSGPNLERGRRLGSTLPLHGYASVRIDRDVPWKRESLGAPWSFGSPQPPPIASTSSMPIAPHASPRSLPCGFLRTRRASSHLSFFGVDHQRSEELSRSLHGRRAIAQPPPYEDSQRARYEEGITRLPQHRLEVTAQPFRAHTFPVAIANSPYGPAVITDRPPITRATKSCDRCRRLKSRCVYDSSNEEASAACARCAHLGADCSFTGQAKRRGPAPKVLYSDT